MSVLKDNKSTKIYERSRNKNEKAQKGGYRSALMENITSIVLSRLWQKFLPFDKSIGLPQSCLFRENFYTLYLKKVMVLVWKPVWGGGGGGGRGHVSRKRKQFTQI